MDMRTLRRLAVRPVLLGIAAVAVGALAVVPGSASAAPVAAATATTAHAAVATPIAAPIRAVSATSAARPTSAHTIACPAVRWGSLTKIAAGMTTAPIAAVRTGRHPCFDRVVIDLRSGSGPLGYQVRYVSTVHREGSGAVVPLRGGARLAVVVRAPAYDVRTGSPTFKPANPAEITRVAGYLTLRQVAFAGSFEGQSTFGIGVRARLPFRVFVLDGPGAGHRLVIDIAHRW